MNSYQVFHSACEYLRKSVDIILVRPEEGGNVGSIARSLANMGITGDLKVVGNPNILNNDSFRFAMHAKERLDSIHHYSTLEEAVRPRKADLVIAATARIGSSHRPHPQRVRTAMSRAAEKLKTQEIQRVKIVFGPESSGLTNSEVAACDWVVTIPSVDAYRSLNLSQAVLIFAYELNLAFLETPAEFRKGHRPSQRQRLIKHIVQLADDVGFILPGDPYKMRPKLESIFDKIPHKVPEIRTLHGLLDQISRTVQKGRIDFKGRYKRQKDSAATFE